ncbi:MAG: hypothetical protein H6707_17225 [Deltaproteobacteria bacterium]|nr:hypothetical protein [Deltaproteobacteria bacterium]
MLEKTGLPKPGRYANVEAKAIMRQANLFVEKIQTGRAGPWTLEGHSSAKQLFFHYSRTTKVKPEAYDRKRSDKVPSFEIFDVNVQQDVSGTVTVEYIRHAGEAYPIRGNNKRGAFSEAVAPPTFLDALKASGWDSERVTVRQTIERHKADGNINVATRRYGRTRASTVTRLVEPSGLLKGLFHTIEKAGTKETRRRAVFFDHIEYSQANWSIRLWKEELWKEAIEPTLHYSDTLALDYVNGGYQKAAGDIVFLEPTPMPKDLLRRVPVQWRSKVTKALLKNNWIKESDAKAVLADLKSASATKE